YDVDLALADHMVVLRYEDRPGVVGTVGRILGEAGINIAGMQVARATVGGEALAVLTVDDTVSATVLGELASEIGATSARSVNLV
ncbi:ACT domain-containing protein, partial [Streptomyces griseomycini]